MIRGSAASSRRPPNSRRPAGSCLVGVKSPLRMNSLVSRQMIVDSRGMVAWRARRAVRAAAFLVSGSLWGPRRAAPARARQSWRGAGIARSQTLYRRARSPYRGAVRVLRGAAEMLVCYYAGTKIKAEADSSTRRR